MDYVDPQVGQGLSSLSFTRLLLRLLFVMFDANSLHVQRSAKRRGCLLSYSQAEPGRALTQPSPRLLAEPCSQKFVSDSLYSSA